jgi:ribulose-phosphate 3-epimerase
MVIIHAEADVNHMHFAAELHKEEIKAGLAILPDTSIDSVEELLDSFDHLLIFSGNLGHFGGKTDLSLLGKIAEAKEINPGIEIGWDGGINDKNAAELVQARVDVLNVGGFIQKSDRPKEAYAKLEALAESTKIK